MDLLDLHTPAERLASARDRFANDPVGAVQEAVDMLAGLARDYARTVAPSTQWADPAVMLARAGIDAEIAGRVAALWQQRLDIVGSTGPVTDRGVDAINQILTEVEDVIDDLRLA